MGIVHFKKYPPVAYPGFSHRWFHLQGAGETLIERGFGKFLKSGEECAGWWLDLRI